jgi:4'-phosphopantetheinyl transferase EntD
MLISVTRTQHGTKPITFHPLRLSDGSIAQMCMLSIDVDGFSPEMFFQHGLEMPTAVSKSVPRRQAEYFYGRLAARHALVSFGQSHAHIGTGFYREPLWPDGIVGSITHNLSYAAAIALDRRSHAAIGIDVESIITPELRDAVTMVAMSSDELAYLSSISIDIDFLITVVFSAKESFYKAAFPSVRRFFDFDAIILRHFDEQHGVLTFEIRESLGAMLTPGLLLKIRFGVIDERVICTSCDW